MNADAVDRTIPVDRVPTRVPWPVAGRPTSGRVRGATFLPGGLGAAAAGEWSGAWHSRPRRRAGRGGLWWGRGHEGPGIWGGRFDRRDKPGIRGEPAHPTRIYVQRD